MTERASICTCGHPRGDHREGLYECVLSCSCLAFVGAPQPAEPPANPPAAKAKTAKRLPTTRKRR